jgi:hypothetical protein
MHLAGLALALQVVAAPSDTANHVVSADLEHNGGRVPPQIVASLVEQPPDLDGRLDDAAWQNAMIVTDFIQVTPNDGTEPSERSEVRVVYDRGALYIAARLYARDPAAIARRLGRRDSYTSSDDFYVVIDSYHDHRTAFRFSVNPAGVRSDAVATNDDRHADHSWEPVWAAATSVDSLGWVVEMRIPFSQLRFSGESEQVWGINFSRGIFRKNERARWSWVPNTEQGYASHLGHLLGLRDIPPPRRLEVLPYTVGTAGYQKGGDPRNPFIQGGAYDVSVGLDLKYGLTSGLTLDATINPDFGQVEADPAVVNLSAFETFYPERRPFFVEGADIFRFGAGSGGFVFGAPQLFYSRRVGRSPSRWISEPDGYVDYPIASRIIGAAKLSGKTGGWSIGALNALTAREYAQVVDSGGAMRNEVVEPLANYTVVSLRRDLRDGASGIGILGTSVLRDLSDPSFDYLRSKAFTGGIDFFHRFAGNRFAFSGSLAASHIRGDPYAITLAQLSSARYYQRPDQDYVSLDTAATSLTGYAASMQLGKVSGNWTYGTDLFAYSPGFEINDGGFETTVDRVFSGVRVQRRWLTPGEVFRNFWISSTFAQTWNFGGTAQMRSAYAGFGGQFLNYWRFNLNGNYNFSAQSDKATRGGPLMERPRQWNVGGLVSTDFRKPVSVDVRTNYARNLYDGWGLFTALEIDFRPGGAVNFEVRPGYNKSHSMGFYVTQRRDELANATYGGRYLFSELVQTSLDLTVRADVAITPNLSLQLWAQPYTASGDYFGFKELAQPGSFNFLRYGIDGGSTISYDRETNFYTVDPDGDGPAESITFYNPDFSLRSFRSNLVMRWEYSPGSTLFLVWNHGRFADSSDPTFGGFNQFGSLLEDPQQNTFLVKVNYWISL